MKPVVAGHDSHGCDFWKTPLDVSYFEKGCRKKVCVHATIPKGKMGHDQYTVPDTVAVEPSFVALL